jgi:hypothetical protein
MVRYHLINGVRVQFTAEEETARDAEETAWSNKAVERKLDRVKEERDLRLKATDWMANSDYTMPDHIKTWRQTLRDLPQNNTTESQYDTLLELNTDGSFKNSIWTQPKE